VDVAELAPGPLAFAHGKVSQAALDDYSARVGRLVAPFGTAPGSARPSLVTSLAKLLGGLTRPRGSA
jgi:hypothetical protein